MNLLSQKYFWYNWSVPKVPGLKEWELHTKSAKTFETASVQLNLSTVELWKKRSIRITSIYIVDRGSVHHDCSTISSLLKKMLFEIFFNRINIPSSDADFNFIVITLRIDHLDDWISTTNIFDDQIRKWSWFVWLDEGLYLRIMT